MQRPGFRERCWEAAEGFTLGLPFCELYYLVFDDEKDEITFVDLPRR